MQVFCWKKILFMKNCVSDFWGIFCFVLAHRQYEISMDSNFTSSGTSSVSIGSVVVVGFFFFVFFLPSLGSIIALLKITWLVFSGYIWKSKYKFSKKSANFVIQRTYLFKKCHEIFCTTDKNWKNSAINMSYCMIISKKNCEIRLLIALFSDFNIVVINIFFQNFCVIIYLFSLR